MRTTGPAIAALLLCACNVKVHADTSSSNSPAASEPTPAAATPEPEPAKAPVDPIPAAFGALTPQIAVDDVVAAMDFYAKAFGATEVMRLPGPDGAVIHGEVTIGDSMLMIDLSNPGVQSPKAVGGTPMTLFMYSADADEAWKVAVTAGATELTPLEDTFWGDRYGELADPFGHRWALASHTEDLTPEQMEKRAQIVAEEMAAIKKTKRVVRRPTKAPKWKSIAGTPSTQRIPEGYETLTMAVTVPDAAAALDFYTKVLGATERNRMPMPDGKLMHAEVVFGKSVLMVADEISPAQKSATTLGGSPVMIHHYTTDATAAYNKALAGGATSILAVTDMPWGDRYAAVVGPGGIPWGLATHIEDVSEAEMAERMKADGSDGTHAPDQGKGKPITPAPAPASKAKPIAPKSTP